MLFALSTFTVFTVLALGFAVANLASADDPPPPYVELNNGQFRVDYLGIEPPYGEDPAVRTVRYAVTNQGCSAGETSNSDTSVPTTGKGRGKGGGGGPKEPKCAGMSHYSVGFQSNISLSESDLIDPSDTSGDCDPEESLCYTTSVTHPMCGTEYEVGISYHCKDGTFSPTYGFSGATKFPGLKFSKNREEESLQLFRTFIFHITYQDDNELYEQGCLEVLVKSGSSFYSGWLLGPVLKGLPNKNCPLDPDE